MNATELADLITDELRTVAQPDRAIQEKAYLKSDLQFLGASFWETQRIVKAFVRGAAPLDHDQLVALVEALWAEPVHERRAAAVVLLELHPKLLSPADLPLLERLLRESRTWALVDGLAPNVVGRILAAAPIVVTPVLDRWSTDPDFWIRRSSLLAELRPLRNGADLAHSCAAPIRCSTRRNSSSARRSAGCCARSASGVRLMAAYKAKRPA